MMINQSSRKLVLVGGGKCPECPDQESLCLTNLQAADLESQLVHCNKCRQHFCAKCGKKAVPSKTKPGKFLCSFCDKEKPAAPSHSLV